MTKAFDHTDHEHRSRCGLGVDRRNSENGTSSVNGVREHVHDGHTRLLGIFLINGSFDRSDLSVDHVMIRK